MKKKINKPNAQQHLSNANDLERDVLGDDLFAELKSLRKMRDDILAKLDRFQLEIKSNEKGHVQLESEEEF